MRRKNNSNQPYAPRPRKWRDVQVPFARVRTAGSCVTFNRTSRRSHNYLITRELLPSNRKSFQGAEGQRGPKRFLPLPLDPLGWRAKRANLVFVFACCLRPAALGRLAVALAARLGGSCRLAGVIGQVPAAALQLEARLADQTLRLSAAILALLQRLVVDLLKGLKDLGAFDALILIKWARLRPPT